MQAFRRYQANLLKAQFLGKPVVAEARIKSSYRSWVEHGTGISSNKATDVFNNAVTFGAVRRLAEDAGLPVDIEGSDEDAELPPFELPDLISLDDGIKFRLTDKKRRVCNSS